MTNEEKAEQLMWCVLKEHTWDDKRQIKECALLMAEWKDKQYSKAFAPILIELDELKQQVKSLLP